MEFFELVVGISGEVAFLLRGLYWSYIDLCLVSTCGSIITWRLRVKYGVVLFEQRQGECCLGLPGQMRSDWHERVEVEAKQEEDLSVLFFRFENEGDLAEVLVLHNCLVLG